MAPPPLMLLVAAGVGLTALLYYYFVSKEERTATGTAYSYGSPSSFSGRRSRCNGDTCTGDTMECSICQEFMYSESSMRILSCGHSFHRRCVDKWFEASPFPSCPNCRQQVR